ncbi:DHA2 family efflux MFS transporter permease subunit [Stappia sp. ICDLI1TA098]
MLSAPPSISLRLWMVAAVTGSGAFMAMLDSTVANLAIDTIARDFDAPLADVQWIATSYLIALALSLPLTAWLARRFGSGRVWAAAILVFVASSVLCGISRDLTTLIVARCLQGLAAGLMVPVGQTVLSVAADRQQLGRLMGTVGFAVALGPALGPGLGGVLIDNLSWRWLFWINVPVGIAAVAAAKYVLPPDEVSRTDRLDTPGLLLIGLGLPLLLYGSAGIGAMGITPSSILPLTFGIALTIAFIIHARRAISPLIDIRLFRRAGFAAAVVTASLTGAAMYGGLLLIPLFLQDSLHQSPTDAGLMLFLMGLGSAIVLPIAGNLTDRYGALMVCLFGSIILLLSTAAFLWSSILPLALISILFVRGGGLALAQMPAMTAAYAAVLKNETSDAATIINIAQRLGGALGAITTVIVLEQAAATDNQHAYRWGFALLVAFAVASMVTSTLLKRPLIQSD